ncbi:G-protein coupled receptor 4 isoform X1 [Anguilla anguilla]|uniref:G-protein coupled receptor 4 isoform X1 n=2 Tax=Anguilla anguilla TaxID=7936 RepID=UPI0015ADAADD|nr:G-protein coupled receptor 4 isoform X1 [Anguilla anguilla]
MFSTESGVCVAVLRVVLAKAFFFSFLLRREPTRHISFHHFVHSPERCHCCARVFDRGTIKKPIMSNGSCNFSLDADIWGLTCIYGLSFSMGLPANLLSLWGLYQLGLSGGGVQLVYLINLLVSDLLHLLTLPAWILYLQRSHRWVYGSAACNFVGYLFYVNLYASVVYLCLVALDRYLAIVHPLGSRRVRTVRVAVLSSLAVWTGTFLFSLSGLYPSVYRPVRGLCLEQYPVSARYARFKIATIVLGFLLPCGILGYTSARIMVALRESPSTSDRERRKIVGTLVVITVIFFVVFGPYHLVGAYKFVAYFLAVDRCDLERSLFLAYRLCFALTSLNSLLDPFFYIFLSNNVRKELKSLRCLGRWGSSKGNSGCNLCLEQDDSQYKVTDNCTRV